MDQTEIYEIMSKKNNYLKIQADSITKEATELKVSNYIEMLENPLLYSLNEDIVNYIKGVIKNEMLNDINEVKQKNEFEQKRREMSKLGLDLNSVDENINFDSDQLLANECYAHESIAKASLELANQRRLKNIIKTMANPERYGLDNKEVNSLKDIVVQTVLESIYNEQQKNEAIAKIDEVSNLLR